MRSLVLIGNIILIVQIAFARDIPGDKRHYSLMSLGKRGTESLGHSRHPISLFTINTQAGNREPMGGFTLGNSISHGLAGYKDYSHNLGHNDVSLGSLALSGGHGGQSYAQSLETLGKTGPVTFGLQAGGQSQAYSAPVYSSGIRGLFAYTSGAGHGLSVPVFTLGGGYAGSGHTAYASAPSPGPHGGSSAEIPAKSHGLYSAVNPSHENTASPSYQVSLASGSNSNPSYLTPSAAITAFYPADSQGSYQNAGRNTYQHASSSGGSNNSQLSSSAGYSSHIYSAPVSGYSDQAAAYHSPSAGYGTSSASYSSPSTAAYSNSAAAAYSNAPAAAYSNPSSSSSAYVSPVSSYPASSAYSAQAHSSHTHRDGDYSAEQTAYYPAVGSSKYDTISYSSSANSKYEKMFSK